MPQVFVTGIGVISALGNNCGENLTRLREGKGGIRKPQHLESNYAETHCFGEVGLSNDELIHLLGLENESGLTRTDLLAIKAFEEAIEHAGLNQEELSSSETAFISSSTVGGMCLTQELYEDANMKSSGSPYLEAYSCGAHTLRLAKKYNIKGYTDTINTACSSSANAIMLGARLIKSGRAKRAIVGGADGLAKYAINGFDSLQILSDVACKPFDENRIGLTIGEGAAYIVLESEEVTKDKNYLAEIVGYGNSTDAFHPSSMSEEATGVKLSISKALNSAGILGDQIDYINAHGTATENNDRIELKGINDLLGSIPPYNSTKSYTGHTFGVAGAMEAIFCILSIQHQELYASLNCDVPIKEFNCAPIAVYEEHANVNYVLSNSFGFAGNCTSLILKSVSDVH